MTGELRVVSWNVRDLLGDPMAVRRVLRALQPDVVCLQEAPRRPGGGYRIARVARDTGLTHIGGGRTSGGTAVLAAEHVRVASVTAFRLPVAHWHTRSRGATLARVEANGTACVIASIHLPLTAAQRVEHAHAVREALRRASEGEPVVVAGDLNEPEASPSWQVFGAVAEDPAPGAAPTFPARHPSGRIDAVLVGAGLDVVAYGDGGADPDDVRRASDHVPVLAVLRAAR